MKSDWDIMKIQAEPIEFDKFYAIGVHFHNGIRHAVSAPLPIKAEDFAESIHMAVLKLQGYINRKMENEK